MRFLISTSLLLLAACGDGFNDTMAYNDIPVVQFAHADRHWRIFDKPDQNTILVTSSIGEAAANGATFGLASGGPKAEAARFQSAAAAYINPRGCQVTSADRLMLETYEFGYIC